MTQRGKTRTVDEWPAPCDKCPEDDRGLLGCGFDPRYKDKCECVYETGSKTCPQWYARQPAVLSVYEWLTPWRTGGLGNAMDLPSVLFDALQILDSELESVKAKIEGEVSKFEDG